MNTHADKTRENKSQSVANDVFQKQSGNESAFQFVDNRPEAITQRKLQERANNSPQVKQLRAIQEMANNYSVQQQQPIQKKENKTGLPDNLKSGIENLSGYSMDDVKVHYNSDKSAQLNAHAYAQGTDIHVASGQEKLLPHEAWHIVQQKQERVKPTMQMKGGVNINDDQGLEMEADVMGEKAVQFETHQDENVFRRNSQEIIDNTFQRKELKDFQEPFNNILSTELPNKLTIQRQVPPQGGGAKEKPNTVYTARGGNDKPFDKDKHPRSMFSFGAHTRNAVFERYNPQLAGNRIISIRSSTGEQVNVEGIQLDHQISWDTISSAMDTHNKKLGSNWNNQVDYSLWDAKMYYNDIDNLVPALGAINASAGEQGVNEIPRIHRGLEIYQGNIQTAWMNLQAGLVAVGHGISDENAERIAILLHNITTTMNEVTEELL